MTGSVGYGGRKAKGAPPATPHASPPRGVTALTTVCRRSGGDERGYSHRNRNTIRFRSRSRSATLEDSSESCPCPPTSRSRPPISSRDRKPTRRPRPRPQTAGPGTAFFALGAAPKPGTVAQTPTLAERVIELLEPSAVDVRPLLPDIPGYAIDEEIGSGGMGVVYRARELAFDRDVAVKVLSERYPVDSVAARRFLDEARITGQLQHPAIPPAHHIGTLSDGRPFLVMKLIKGDTLADLLMTEPTNRGRFVPVFAQLCQADR